MNEELACSRSSTKIEKLFHNLRSLRFAWSSCSNQSDDVLHNEWTDSHAHDQFLDIHDRPSRKDLAHFGPFAAGRRGHNPFFFFRARIPNFDIEHESVQLGFRQWISSFLFDWILSCDRKKGFGQLVGVPTDGNFTFLHGLQKCGLCFRRRSVDFVGQQNVGEDWPFDEAKFAFSLRIFL